MTLALALKATGEMPETTLANIGNASVDPSAASRISESCFTPNTVDRELAETDAARMRDFFAPLYGAEPLYPGDDGASLISGGEAIRLMHQRRLAATGRGSFPPGQQCIPDHYPHEGYHATLLYIEQEAFLRHNDMRRDVTDEEWQSVVVDARCWPTIQNPVQSVAQCKRTFVYGGEAVAGFDRPEWAQASDKRNGDVFNVFDMSTWLTLEATRRAGCLFLQVFTGPDGQHNVHEKMIPIPGSTSGFAYFNNATCGDHVTSNIDNTIGYSLGRSAGLRTHEFGHNNNLQHEFRSPQSAHRSIMSYSQDNTPFQGYRLAQDPYWVNTPGNHVEDHSWDVLRRFYGGEAAKLVIDSPTPPPVLPPIPGILPGQLQNGVYIIDGEIGPIPAGAVGGIYIVERIGNTNRHRFVPKPQV